MNREEAIKYGTEQLKDEYLDARDGEFIEIALEALKQMPVITTTGEEGVIYYPQVEGVTPTVISAGKQDPCSTCGYEEGSIYCKEHCPHEAKMDDLVKLCIEQERDCKTCIHSDKGNCAGTERCHECMWESKYEQEPCEDVIDRAEAMTEMMMFAGNVKSDEEDIYIKVSDAVQLLRDLPSITLQPKTGHWIQTNEFFINQDGQFIYKFICSECKSLSYFRKSNKEAIGANVCPNCGAKMQ